MPISKSAKRRRQRREALSRIREAREAEVAAIQPKSLEDIQNAIEETQRQEDAIAQNMPTVAQLLGIMV
jgi:hypothetical protein